MTKKFKCIFGNFFGIRISIDIKSKTIAEEQHGPSADFLNLPSNIQVNLTWLKNCSGGDFLFTRQKLPDEHPTSLHVIVHPDILWLKLAEEEALNGFQMATDHWYVACGIHKERQKSKNTKNTKKYRGFKWFWYGGWPLTCGIHERGSQLGIE